MTRTLTFVLAAAVALGACGSSTHSGSGSSRTTRAIDARGSHVMGFDLTRTVHIFTNRPDGGTETVRARKATDREQIGLIRQHLRHEATRFQAGDFSDPAKIHGANMPGLAVLRTAGSRLTVIYVEEPDGATLDYLSSDPTIVEAIHQWFAAQLHDHGAHAMAG